MCEISFNDTTRGAGARVCLCFQTLKGLCLDSRRSEILQRLELSLDILTGTVERIFNTAEVLGAVHQEARVSRAVELMVAHVENLRRRHDRSVADLEEAKKTIQQQNPYRNIIDPRASPDPEESDGRRKTLQQNSGRRRVSITLIPSQIQEKIKRKRATRSFSKDSFLTCSSSHPSFESSCSPMTNDDDYSLDDRPLDPDETPPEAPAAELPPPPTPDPECLPSKQLTTRKIQNQSSPLDTLRQRHKGKAALTKKKADKDKKRTNVHRQFSVSTCRSLWRKRPLAHWLYCCRALFCTYLFVLFCVATMTYFLLKHHDEAPAP
ncbi:uncharacterized protein LOC115011133 [Cottoperca gobio]|uniref:Uncharacterized protein LOC115011133 n=1 Tax=Cottoperca gobio TaxID=56716 RepID=A0A6J2Q3Y5_COTGO|nr:uncharacterized protein LOC115011133 [Cottoperca gobio]